MALWYHLLDERSLGGYDWAAMRAYLIISFFTATLAFGAEGWDTAERILDGMIAIDLTKPVDFQRARAAEFAGDLISQTPTGVMGVVAAWLLFSPPGPASALAGLLTAVSIVLIIPLAFGVVYLSTLVCFWTRRYLGIMWAREALLGFFSGMMIPLALMPTWLQALSWALPFPHFTTTPTSIYLGRVDTLGALGLIAAEAAWVVVLWPVARVLWRRAVKNVTVHGG
jgi:ABC-2 type transport system permease protein